MVGIPGPHWFGKGHLKEKRLQRMRDVVAVVATSDLRWRCTPDTVCRALGITDSNDRPKVLIVMERLVTLGLLASRGGYKANYRLNL